MGQTSTKNDTPLFPIGIGTWGIGGLAEKDPNIDFNRQVEALTYMFDKGMNFVEANMFNAQGYSVELIAKAIQSSTKKREDIFICQAIYVKPNKSFSETIKELDIVQSILETDYVDTVEFSMGSFLESSFEEITEWVDGILQAGRSRYTSITNANLEMLKQYHQKFGDKFLSHEIVLNFEVRNNVDEGIIPYAEKNGILNIIYQPIRRNRTAKRNWTLLLGLSEKYGKTQNQIIFNWLTSKGYLPITKSESISHIDETLNSLDFTLSEEDIELIDSFSPPGYTAPKIDWYKKNPKGVRIDQVSNIFDEIYKK